MDALPSRPAPVTVFYSYAHEDEALLDALRDHLKILERRGLLASWHDRCIAPGDDWERAIDLHLQRAELVLLLLSNSFFGSDYIFGTELAVAMRRHEEKAATVVPIVVRAVDIDPEDADVLPFLKLQALPTDMRPVTSWPNVDEAWTNVARGLRGVVRSIIERRAQAGGAAMAGDGASAAGQGAAAAGQGGAPAGQDGTAAGQGTPSAKRGGAAVDGATAGEVRIPAPTPPASTGVVPPRAGDPTRPPPPPQLPPAAAPLPPAAVPPPRPAAAPPRRVDKAAGGLWSAILRGVGLATRGVVAPHVVLGGSLPPVGVGLPRIRVGDAEGSPPVPATAAPPVPSPAAPAPAADDPALARVVGRFSDAMALASRERGVASDPELLRRGASALIDRDDVPRVLWVDDRPEGNAREREALASVQVEVVAAASTAEARALLEARGADPFDLVVSDWERAADGPQAGLALLDWLRAHRPALPLVYYHGAFDPQRRARRAEEARSRGAFGEAVLPDELLALAMRALGGRAPENPPAR